MVLIQLSGLLEEEAEAKAQSRGEQQQQFERKNQEDGGLAGF